MSALLLLIIATFGMSNVAKAYCPPADECGTWYETVQAIPVLASGATIQVTYKFCYRINTCTGNRQIFLSEINYPDYPYGNGDWSSFDLAYFYNLCVEHLTDSIWDFGLTGFYKQSIPLCGEGEPAVVVEVGHHACVIHYSTFDTQKGATINVIGHCEMYVTAAPDCQTIYSYCFEEKCCKYNPLSEKMEKYLELQKTKIYTEPTSGGVSNSCSGLCTITITNPDGSTYEAIVIPEYICE
jgi:hypothetical protein